MFSIQSKTFFLWQCSHFFRELNFQLMRLILHWNKDFTVQKTNIKQPVHCSLSTVWPKSKKMSPPKRSSHVLMFGWSTFSFDFSWNIYFHPAFIPFSPRSCDDVSLLWKFLGFSEFAFNIFKCCKKVIEFSVYIFQTVLILNFQISPLNILEYILKFRA